MFTVCIMAIEKYWIRLDNVYALITIGYNSRKIKRLQYKYRRVGKIARGLLFLRRLIPFLSIDYD